MATEKRPFTMRMKDENFDKIKYLAEYNMRSIAAQIEYLIEQEIHKFESEHGTIKTK